MSQLNKQTVDLSLFEQRPGTHGLFSTEKIIIFCLILLGFVGLFYSIPKKAGSISAITTNTNWSDQGGDMAAAAFIPEEEIRDEIQLVNTPIVGKETTFALPANREDFKLVSINFGDGIVESLMTKNIIGHVYTRPGKHQVRVKVLVRHNKVMYLTKTIEVLKYETRR